MKGLAVAAEAAGEEGITAAQGRGGRRRCCWEGEGTRRLWRRESSRHGDSPPLDRDAAGGAASAGLRPGRAPGFGSRRALEQPLFVLVLSLGVGAEFGAAVTGCDGEGPKESGRTPWDAGKSGGTDAVWSGADAGVESVGGGAVFRLGAVGSGGRAVCCSLIWWGRLCLGVK